MPAEVATLAVGLVLNTGTFFAALGTSLNTASSSITSWGRKMSLAVTIPLVTLGTAIARIGIEYETAFTGVLKAVEETTDGMGNLTALGEELYMTFRDLSMEIPMSAASLAELGAIAGQLGIAGEDLEEFVGLVAKLGVTTDLSAEEAATGLARLMTMLGTSSDEIDELASTLVYLGNNTAAVETEILRMALRFAGSASIIGMSEKGILGLAAAMSAVQIRAEMGGTAISRVMIDMANAVAEGGDELKLLADVARLSVEEFSRLFEEQAEVAILTFVEGLDKIDEAGGNVFQVLEDLGMGEIRVRETLLKLASSHDKVREALELANAGWEENVALDREFNLYAQTTESLLKMLWNRLKDVAISIKDAFDPAIKSALIGMLDFLDGIVSLARTSPELLRTIVTIAAVIAAIGPALVILGAIIGVLNFAISAILSPLGLLISGLVALGVAAGAFVIAKYEIESFTDAVIVFSGFIARALDWIAERLSGLVDFIAKAAEWGASAMESFAQGIIGAAGLVIQAIGYIAKIITGLLGPGSPPAILPGLTDWGREAINEFLHGMTTADFGILNKVGDIIAGHLKGLGFEDEDELAEATTRAQIALARVVYEARTAGEASTAAWQELRNSIQDSTGDIERYIRLRMTLAEAEQELASIEQHRSEVMQQLDEERFRIQIRHKEELRGADAKVQAAEEALQKFREQAAEIPERFTRGRERQLQAELRAVQKERDVIRERHEIEMQQFDIRRRQIQDTLDAQVAAAQKRVDLLQEQTRWLEELLGLRYGYIESFEGEESALSDLGDLWERTLEGIMPGLKGLKDSLGEVGDKLKGVMGIWKAFWMGLTGQALDEELKGMTAEERSMYQAGLNIWKAWDKFAGVLERVWNALSPIVDVFNKIFGGEMAGVNFGALFEAGGLEAAFDTLVDKISTWLEEKWPTINAKLLEWSERFWAWVSEAVLKLDEKLQPLLDKLEEWAENPKTQARLLRFGWAIGMFLIDAIRLVLENDAALAKILMALTYLFLEVSGRLFDVLRKVGWAIALGVLGGILEKLDAKNWIPNLKQSISAGLQDLVNSIVQFFVDLPDDLDIALLDLFLRVVAWFVKLYNRIVGESIIPDLIRDVVNEFAKLPGKILAKIEQGLIDIYNRFVRLKNDIIGVLGNLVSEGLAKLGEWVNGIINTGQQLYDDLVGHSIFPDMVRDINASLGNLNPMLGAITGLTPAAVPVAGGMAAGLQLQIVNYWDASISSKDRAELSVMMQNTTYRALDEIYGGA